MSHTRRHITVYRHSPKKQRVNSYIKVVVAAQDVVKAAGGFGSPQTWGQKKLSEVTVAVINLERALHRVV